MKLSHCLIEFIHPRNLRVAAPIRPLDVPVATIQHKARVLRRSSPLATHITNKLYLVLPLLIDEMDGDRANERYARQSFYLATGSVKGV